MKKTFALICLVALAGCGSTREDRASTGGVTGAVVGLAVGGPVGGVVGAAAGGTGGAILPTGVDKLAHQGYDKVTGRSGQRKTEDVMRKANKDIMDVQQELKDQNLYDGRVDGIMGVKTRRAISDFQKKQGREPTGILDEQTIDDLSH